MNDTIQVSSDDPIPGTTPPPPIRRSASGGTILLQSNLTTGTGITVGANGQLQVNKVVRGLGHGLDEAAVAAAVDAHFYR